MQHSLLPEFATPHEIFSSVPGISDMLMHAHVSRLLFEMRVNDSSRVPSPYSSLTMECRLNYQEIKLSGILAVSKPQQSACEFGIEC